MDTQDRELTYRDTQDRYAGPELEFDFLPDTQDCIRRTGNEPTQDFLQVLRIMRRTRKLWAGVNIDDSQKGPAQ